MNSRIGVTNSRDNVLTGDHDGRVQISACLMFDGNDIERGTVTSKHQRGSDAGLLGEGLLEDLH